MSKKIFVWSVLLVFTLLLTACGQTSRPRQTGQTGNKETDQSVEKVQDLINKVDQQTQGIIVPANLITACPMIYWQEKNEEGMLKDCDEFGSGPVCSYYKEIMNGQEKTKLLEYKTECHACRFYGQTGQTSVGTTELISIGWEKSPCTQGMYQKKYAGL